MVSPRDEDAVGWGVVVVVSAVHVPGCCMCLVRGGVSAPWWPFRFLLLVPPAALGSGGTGGEFRP